MSYDDDVWAADVDKDSTRILCCVVDVDKDTEMTPFIEVLIIVILSSGINLQSKQIHKAHSNVWPSTAPSQWCDVRRMVVFKLGICIMYVYNCVNFLFLCSHQDIYYKIS